MRTSKITTGTLKQPQLTGRGLTNKVYYVWHILDNKCLYKSGVYSKQDAEQQQTKWLEYYYKKELEAAE
jgi:hypothetical protein